MREVKKTDKEAGKALNFILLTEIRVQSLEKALGF